MYFTVVPSVNQICRSDRIYTYIRPVLRSQSPGVSTVMSLDNASHYSAYVDITLTAFDKRSVVYLDNISHYSTDVDITLLQT